MLTGGLWCVLGIECRRRYLAIEARLPEKVEIALNEAVGAAEEGLLALSVAVGLEVLRSMMEAEVAEIAGPKGKHLGNRQAFRHGTEKGSVVLGRPPGARRGRRGSVHRRSLPSGAAGERDDDRSRAAQKVREDLGLPLSVGVSANKLLAKIANTSSETRR